MGRIGEDMICEKCKIVFVRTGTKQRVCPTCAKENQRAKSREYNKTHPYPKKKKTTKPVTKHKSTLAAMNQAAREHDMTYGQYVAALKNGLVEPPDEMQKGGKRKK